MASANSPASPRRPTRWRNGTRRTPPPGPDFQAQHDFVVLEQRNRLGQGASGARTQWLALRGNGDLGQGHRPCRRQCELAHDPGLAHRYGDRRALHPQGDLADAGRRLRLATGLAARRMAPLRPAAIAEQHRLRRRQRRDAQISNRLPAVVLPAGRGRGRDGAVVRPRRAEVRAAVLLDRRGHPPSAEQWDGLHAKWTHVHQA